jgi:hypothetical protein
MGLGFRGYIKRHKESIQEYGGLEGNKVWKQTLIKTIVKQMSSTFSSM